MVTFCTLHVAQRMHFFEPKAIDGQTVILFGLLNGTSIGLLNLSLGFNSIGFYQVSVLIPSILEKESIRCSNSVFPADDKAGHHTFHSTVGNYIPEEKIQVRKIRWSTLSFSMNQKYGFQFFQPNTVMKSRYPEAQYSAANISVNFT
jgi:hypothetical protein